MRTLHLLAVTQLFALALAMPAPAMAQTLVPLPPFRSVEMQDGAHAILRHGPTQRVTLLKGSLDYTRVTIADGGRLVIDKCTSPCPRGYDLEIEIVTPDIARISIADGGTIQSRGSFPRQAEIGVSVRDGGTIDIRSMTVDSVTASVEQGGIILTMPQTVLFASVVQGGNITYWGNARVKSSVRHGGVVTRGTAAEADKPLSESSSSVPSVPPIPAVRPIQTIRNRDPGSRSCDRQFQRKLRDQSLWSRYRGTHSEKHFAGSARRHDEKARAVIPGDKCQWASVMPDARRRDQSFDASDALQSNEANG